MNDWREYIQEEPEYARGPILALVLGFVAHRPDQTEDTTVVVPSGDNSHYHWIHGIESRRCANYYFRNPLRSELSKSFDKLMKSNPKMCCSYCVKARRDSLEGKS